MRALILAAGLGERLRPLTLKRAKPALEFLNMPMLAFPYFWLDTLSLSDVVFNTHHLPESIRHAAMHVVNPRTQLHFTHEDAILGSGGGIWNARFNLQWDSDFAVANGDAVATFAHADALEQMLVEHKRRKALATLLVCPLEGVGTKIPGVWSDPFGEVVNFGKAPRRPGLECLHYASFMIFSERIWKFLPEGPSNILYDVLDAAIVGGEKVIAHRVNDMRWFETGNASDYLSATKQCLELIRDGDPLSKYLLQMLERFAPQHTLQSDFKNLRLIADSADCADWSQLSGPTVLGDEVVIEAGARLEGCVALPAARIKAGTSHRHEVII